MTKGKSHRELFMRKVFEDGMTVREACLQCGISKKTDRRWIEMRNLTGNFAPLRHRISIPGVMCLEHQELLKFIISNNRNSLIVEIADLLAAETGYIYSERLVRQVMFRQRFVCRLANELSPLERDLELRRYYREQVMHPGGAFTAPQLLFIDESSKKLKDCRRTRAWRVKGDKVAVPAYHTNADDAACVITSLSLEGIQCVTVIDVNEEGNVNGERFIQAFEDDILAQCEPYPGNRSVIVMDITQVHMKLLITALCQQRGVLVIYLPPYSFDYNPIELVFNAAKTKLRNRYGHGVLPPGHKIGDLFKSCLEDCITPEIACNMFVKCYIPVTPQDREWANR